MIASVNSKHTHYKTNLLIMQQQQPTHKQHNTQTPFNWHYLNNIK